MKNSVRILAAICAIVLLLTAIPFTASAKTLEDYDAEIEALREKYEQAEKEKKEAKELLKLLQEEAKAIDGKVAAIEAKIAPIQENIDNLTAEIEACEQRIAELQVEIDETDRKKAKQDAEIEKTYDVLKKRLRAAYIAGETSELEIFLNATDFSDFLARTELIRQVSKHDTEVVNTLRGQVAELNKLKEELDAKRTETEDKKTQIAKDRVAQQADMAVLQAEKSELEKIQRENENNIAKQNKLIAQINENSKEYKDLMEKAEREKAEFSAQLDKDIANDGSSGDGSVNNGTVNHNFRVSSRGCICPIQRSSVYYSANFASHSSRGTASVDFCAPANTTISGKTYYTSKGAKIYAIASGKVTKSTFASSTYGHYINIDHGNGLSSLYAHMDARYVQVGDYVVQGQVIGLLGNTGNCWPRPTASNPVAGSHLHFEMRLNGNRVNPENYMPSPLV